MGPLSAVAVSFWLTIYGLTDIKWITATPFTLGVFALIAAGVVMFETFVLGHLRRRD